MGILVNPTRGAVVEFKKSLTAAEKLKLKQFIEENRIVASRIPELHAIHFTGELIDKIRQTVNTNVPDTGLAGTMSSSSTTMLEKLTAVVDDDPSFNHYTFIVKN